MLAAPRHGFVFLCMTKAGSTAVEEAFATYAQVILRGPPSLKHMNVVGFHRHIAPLLKAHGWPRRHYQVVTVIREPVDWLSSWWRYRSRDELRDAKGRRGQNYAGHRSFKEWVDEQINNDTKGIGRPSRFVRRADGAVGVDRLWKYEHIDQLRKWLSERVGEDVQLPAVNVSPARDCHVSDDLRYRIEDFFEAEYELWRKAD
jgi:hypothetical protein